MQERLRVSSEVGRLKAVLLHRPGRELESLTPQYLDSMLFEDIPFLEQMQNEHDMFAQLLIDQGCAVYYIEQLLEEVLGDAALRLEVVRHLVDTAHLHSPSLKKIILEHLQESDPQQLVAYLIGGLLKDEIDDKVTYKSLSYFIRDAYPYYISPLPNLYFTRDPATMVKQGFFINLMKTESRRRENWLVSLVARHHRLFHSVRMYDDCTNGSSIEGGDILIINDTCAVIGSSARTDAWAIEAFARTMLKSHQDGGEGLKEIIVIQIPYTRAYMHLDTVFTMVDIDKFCIFPGVESALRVFYMTQNSRDSLKIEEVSSLKEALKKALGLPSVDIIRSGGDDMIASAREQWNDSTNTLAIAPGTVVTYRRNVVSNETLARHNIQVFPIRGSELVRGRGGPRCMSMPLLREPL
ncbi:MAG: arginine deiminase [Sphaerochaetaceae bacterium]|jgi:arginine deiminase|nr:arginine deiminase [Sphaerochaetaceae bacterium]NLO60621.1 arginine deiminase [Spirochaetales bacterium]MDD2407097.1 arginine deiminase [Sphaerochaetaceae bacterium]MDD3670125.1 arginine deiminase [Sphaerochaetaceae bacterium]MDD4258726.1 arginine deiminase [Sphaerochaetaceae bacterium]